MEAYLRFIKEVETLMQINNDTTKDFCSDGMIQCRLCNRDVAFPSLFMPQAAPSRKTWRRPLMVRQPYSVAVLSTE